MCVQCPENRSLDKRSIVTIVCQMAAQTVADFNAAAGVQGGGGSFRWNFPKCNQEVIRPKHAPLKTDPVKSRLFQPITQFIYAIGQAGISLRTLQGERVSISFQRQSFFHPVQEFLSSGLQTLSSRSSRAGSSESGRKTRNQEAGIPAKQIAFRARPLDLTSRRDGGGLCAWAELPRSIQVLVASLVPKLHFVHSFPSCTWERNCLRSCTSPAMIGPKEPAK